ncbi:hypothetical protein TCAL_09797 [Tigriopus californicus]|uniref:C3H1-type domain-containing protein n=1 Tax=Tigriopus californicus TaxID=6832 RepID=A0A553PQT4_TIGCA|nr:zinc finger CCCH domain-containing protein 10-like [Tigriopus californicus]TRY80048.1 hypothetical protein TCAL_09797 [Tigriopus californicus]|eukprot:TCALIF_09797-PA protein Name:"Similar to Zc3h10 Zinc finger CCCH domain-containing protein 10 (Mus musculus)" AED:0.06 eAED:0.06 QI:0/-1/0/1/-1/1/1/0/454
MKRGAGAGTPQPKNSQKVKANPHPTSVKSQPVKEDECRDYLRNICSRGNKCKFYHPTPSERAQKEVPPIQREVPISPLIKPMDSELNDALDKRLQDSVVFCHDFLNKGDCVRSHCRFIHCNLEEEAEYKRSGYFPPHVRDQAIRKGVAPDMPVHFGGRPICKDFVKGDCVRNQCRFRHLTSQQYDLELDRMLRQPGGPPGSGLQNTPEGPYMFERGPNPGFYQSALLTNNNLEKKRRIDETLVQYTRQQVQSDHDRNLIEMLQHENLLLKQKLDELKKQVQDLSTTNEFLLDQNAHLRLGVKQATTSVVSVAAGQAPTQLTASLPPNPPPISLGIQPPTISIAPAMVTAPVSVPSVQPMAAPHSLSLSVASLPQPATISIAPAGTIAGIDAAVSLPVQSLSNVTMTCHAAPPDMANVASQSGGSQPPSAPPPNTVHVQETRLVTYPITSIRQTM